MLNRRKRDFKDSLTRRLHGIKVFNYNDGAMNEKFGNEEKNKKRTAIFERFIRNNGQKQLLRNFETSQAMNFFPVKIAATWNQLPENIVSAGTVNTFKNRLDKFWITNPPSTTSY
ncbi:hypothetical protein FHG87_011774 [Trinorchestia longiramus]|nr:hypothetical protein FHG87_011774 [Trinorchestia longiramus]